MHGGRILYISDNHLYKNELRGILPVHFLYLIGCDQRLSMTNTNLEIVKIKNQWLKSHVDVEYPTPGSIKGCELYFSRKEGTGCKPYFCDLSADIPDGLTIYPVDFHRLTVMFALIQANVFSDPVEQQSITEFLTQIIYSPPCTLYLGFFEDVPVLAGIVTQTSDAVLISDLVVDSRYSELSLYQVTELLYRYLNLSDTAPELSVFVEA